MSRQSEKPNKRSYLATLVVSAIVSFLFLMLWIGFNWLTLGFNATDTKVRLLKVHNERLAEHLPGFGLTELSASLKQNSSVKQAAFQAQVLADKSREASQSLLTQAGDYLPGLSNTPSPLGKPFDSSVKAGITLITQGWHLLKLASEIVCIKLVILIAAIPLFFLLGAVGLIDGLSQREIRTAELGRESSYLFHQLNKWVFHLVFVVLFIWLSLPVSIEPVWILGPLSLLFAYMLSMTASRFKKHL